MTFDRGKHHRRSIRLSNYDYSQSGTYFVTVCSQNRDCLFGEIVAAAMLMNPAGQMLEKWWSELPHKFQSIQIDEHAVMPNHFHGIIIVTNQTSRADPVRSLVTGHPRWDVPTPDMVIRRGDPAWSPTARPTLGDAIHWFKTMTTNEYIRKTMECGWPPFADRLWQRNYYEHVVRDEQDLERIRAYIRNNAFRWQDDEDNPARVLRSP